MLAILAGLSSPSTPSAANVWGANVWGPDVWGADVWGAEASSPSTGIPNVWGANVWGPHVWGAHVWASVETTTASVGTGKYAAEHAAALADITAAGASPITVVRWRADVATSIPGAAIQVRGDPARYKAQSLVLSTMPTLLFCPTTYGLRAFTDEFVMPGDVVSWNGVSLVVKDIDTVAPDGVVIISRIVAG